MWKKTTAAVLLGATAVLIGYDVAVFAHSGVEATISQVILWAARDTPAIAFAAGFLCGHFFWPQHK